MKWTVHATGWFSALTVEVITLGMFKGFLDYSMLAEAGQNESRFQGSDMLYLRSTNPLSSWQYYSKDLQQLNFYEAEKPLVPWQHLHRLPLQDSLQIRGSWMALSAEILTRHKAPFMAHYYPQSTYFIICSSRLACASSCSISVTSYKTRI